MVEMEITIKCEPGGCSEANRRLGPARKHMPRACKRLLAEIDPFALTPLSIYAHPSPPPSLPLPKMCMYQKFAEPNGMLDPEHFASHILRYLAILSFGVSDPQIFGS